MSIVKIKLSEIEKIDFYVPAKRMSITQAYNTVKFNGKKPTLICNGTLFNMASSTNATITNGVDEGKRFGFTFTTDGIKIVGDNMVTWGNKTDADCRDLICGSPVLLKDGKTVMEWNRKPSTQVTGKHIRTCVGYGNGNFIVCVTDTEETLDTMVATMKANGCEYVCNLDGGGSSSLIYNGKTIRNTSRLLANFICIWLKETQTNNKEEKEVLVKKDIYVDGKAISADTITTDGKTLVELRKLAEMLGMTVNYDSATKRIDLISKK